MEAARRRPLIWIVLAASLGAASSARAAEKSPDVARAEALFEEGRKLMASRDFARACPKLAESQALDPAAGTLLNLAVCYERAGKTASAWATYKDAELSARRVGEADRAEAARAQAAALEPKLARLTFTVPPEARVAGLEVLCDGQAVREPTWGDALPYDPGPHAIEARAPGHAAWSTRVDVDAARSIAVAIPVLTELPPPPADAARDAAIDPHRGDGQRVAGAVVGAVGLIGVGVGAFAGLRAKTKYDDALAACNGTTTCPDARGPALRDDASTWGAASTIAFAAGGVALASGALLFFAAPSAGKSVAIVPAARGAGLGLAGRF